MPGEQKESWETARLRMVARWQGVLKHVRSRDEAGVLELVNTMDEFCEAALRSKRAAGGTTAKRCDFCRAFTENGGCLDLLARINRAVFRRHWDAARALAETQIERLEATDFSAADEVQPAGSLASGWMPGDRSAA
jgi:hypothetical protein